MTAMSQTVYEVHRLDEASWRIEEGGVRTFLVQGSERAMLVDSGFGTGNLREVVDSLTSLPVMLVNTHADRDHVGCNALFGPAFMHPAEYDRYCEKSGGDKETAPLWEGDVIDLGGRRFEVILIPGHTPGSIALLDAANRVLISGDSVQAGAIYMFGQGRNAAAYEASMVKLQGMSGRFDSIWPSHGPLPLEAAVIGGLVDGARKLQAGLLPEIESTVPDMPARLFDAGVAKFLYD